MRRRVARSVRPPKPAGYSRDQIAMLVALVTTACLGAAFLLANDTRFLMPGPLVSGHSAIENCNACHTKSGSGSVDWIHSLVDGDPLADSRACLTCHRMPDTAFNAHSASAQVLAQSTKRLTKVAAETPAPQWARAQNAAFPTQHMIERGLYCATCHQEHKGANLKLNKIADEQCHSCHVVKFDTFDGNHPEFDDYPFKRRTPITYDHTGHIGEHFPEVAKKYPKRRIPTTCSSCHNSRADRRIMSVAPFEQTCSSCHLDQITGKERVSGPKGIAFLTLPGLDLQTLKKKNAPIGEWPPESEAELTPFMKVMISRTGRGRSLIKTVDKLNLQDLTDATDGQVEAVTNLVWEIKRLFYALISGKASDVLGNLNINCGAKLSADLVADLTASIPRDVVVSAQQQWLPNLAAEMANRQVASDNEQGCWIEAVGGWSTTISDSEVAVDGEGAGIAKSSQLAEASRQLESKDAPGAVIKNLGVDPYGRLVKTREDEAEAARALAAKAAIAAKADPADRFDTAANAKSGKEAALAVEPPRTKTADQTDDLLNLTEEEVRSITGAVKGAAVRTFTIIARPDAGKDGGKEAPSADELPPPMKAGLKDAEPAEATGRRSTTIAQADAGKEAPSANKAADQTDDLLNPTAEELRATGAPSKNSEKAAPPEGAARQPAAAASAPPDNAASTDAKAAEKAPQPEAPAARANAEGGSKSAANAPAVAPAVSTAAAAPQAGPTRVISIESGVDPESWAEYGGWYRQDYAVYYRPTGHKDKFIYSWLYLTGPQAPKGDRSPAAAVFDYLTGKDAQGSCTKCHSVDDVRGKGRLVNFSPPKFETVQGRFTTFIHEPHFVALENRGLLDNRGCLTCHNLAKGRPYLQSYTQGNPKNFASNFGVVKKELCQTCHTRSMARQDCLLCHKYHVNGVITPIMDTKLPTE